MKLNWLWLFFLALGLAPYASAQEVEEDEEDDPGFVTSNEPPKGPFDPNSSYFQGMARSAGFINDIKEGNRERALGQLLPDFEFRFFVTEKSLKAAQGVYQGEAEFEEFIDAFFSVFEMPVNSAKFQETKHGMLMYFPDEEDCGMLFEWKKNGLAYLEAQCDRMLSWPSGIPVPKGSGPREGEEFSKMGKHLKRMRKKVMRPKGEKRRPGSRPVKPAADEL